MDTNIYWATLGLGIWLQFFRIFHIVIVLSYSHLFLEYFLADVVPDLPNYRCSILTRQKLWSAEGCFSVCFFFYFFLFVGLQLFNWLLYTLCTVLFRKLGQPPNIKNRKGTVQEKKDTLLYLGQFKKKQKSISITFTEVHIQK